MNIMLQLYGRFWKEKGAENTSAKTMSLSKLILNLKRYLLPKNYLSVKTNIYGSGQKTLFLNGQVANI